MGSRARGAGPLGPGEYGDRSPEQHLPQDVPKRLGGRHMGADFSTRVERD